MALALGSWDVASLLSLLCRIMTYQYISPVRPINWLDTDVCPLKVILPYMVTRGTNPGPFFFIAEKIHWHAKGFILAFLSNLFDYQYQITTLIVSNWSSHHSKRCWSFRYPHSDVRKMAKSSIPKVYPDIPIQTCQANKTVYPLNQLIMNPCSSSLKTHS